MSRAFWCVVFVLFMINGNAQESSDKKPVIESAATAVVFFSPQGTVKGVRQVTARFSNPMVPFGDPRLSDPFTLSCPMTGKGRWADTTNWVYDFDQDLPAGVECQFKLKPNLKDVAGGKVAGESSYAFSTGGPAILTSIPRESSWNYIDENQVFILGLDSPAQAETIKKNGSCAADGVTERIGLKVLEGEQRKTVLSEQHDFFDQYLIVAKRSNGVQTYFAAQFKQRGTRSEALLKLANAKDSPVVVVQCQRPLPNNADVRLVWGEGIKSASGVATEQTQELAFHTRENFRATFSCTRVNKGAPCLPILPMSLDFTAPVSKELASKIELIAKNGQRYPANLPKDGAEDVNGLSFNGPFPERTELSLKIPKELKDDAGRALTNADRFPLKIRVDVNPPLAKFAARFGVIEANGDAALPVTLRNLESSVQGSRVDIPAVDGKSIRIENLSPSGITDWMRKLQAAEREIGQVDDTGRYVITQHAGEVPMLSGGESSQFKLPKPNGRKAFEVVGIPLKKPGFYVVELASPRLGQALLGKAAPYYVQSAALVTNLSVHFKHGRESSLIWVTSLDKGNPMPNAEVKVSSCSGYTYWAGRTDSQGIARIPQALEKASGCLNQWDLQYFVSAKTKEDYSFVLSGWNEGIDSWRFRLPVGSPYQAVAMVSVLDRSLLRAGEVVHMKHYARQKTGQGFAHLDTDKLGDTLTLSHVGSDDKYELPLEWDDKGVAESVWTVPKEAKQGEYRLSIQERFNSELITHDSGHLRVEAFRIPLMKATLQGPSKPLVGSKSAALTAQVNYLSGGGAGNMSTEIRGIVEPYQATFADWEDFVFANGSIKEGAVSNQDTPWHIGEYEAEDSEAGDSETSEQAVQSNSSALKTQRLTLDAQGGGQFTINDIPRSEKPQSIQVEMEYRDPNGEFLSSSTRLKWWPSSVILGIKNDPWTGNKDKVRFQVAAIDTQGKPLANNTVKVDFYKQESYTHRKRLIGGFYGYESHTELHRLGQACAGNTDSKGILVCEVQPPSSGNLVLLAQTKDTAGNSSSVHTDIWVAGGDEWWFEQGNDNRMDILPEKKRYEPGETAQLQVRMPFRKANALVTIEREGVLDAFVQPLSGKLPVVNVPLKGNHAPNVFVSVLAVRGRANTIQPTALVDLGKPSFRLGYAELKVGWRAHELKVKVLPEREVYQIRSHVKTQIEVVRADGGKLPAGAEIALAAVDEGLLELMPNDSWNLLDAMMQQRGVEVETSTAQLQVIGKRHYGRKAVPSGGGGGHGSARELFDPLLTWTARVKLDAKGRAVVDVPLNDALSSFRIVAIASAGDGLFGTGFASVRSHQDLMLFSGLPTLVRENDQYRAGFTVRNASDRAMRIKLSGSLNRNLAGKAPQALYAKGLQAQELDVDAGKAIEVAWNIRAPYDADSLSWQVVAQEIRDGKPSGLEDKIKVSQVVASAFPVRVYQSTVERLDKPYRIPVKIPADAVPGRGSVELNLRPSLLGSMSGVSEYLRYYPFNCMEQRVSQAIVLRDTNLWSSVTGSMPAYLDRDGLLKYFPEMPIGDETLTAYVISIADEAGWEIPEGVKQDMIKGLTGFVQGKVRRDSALPTADLAIRKINAIAALSRAHAFKDDLLQSFDIQPNLWPTSAVLDWVDVLQREASVPDNADHLKKALIILRSRLNFQGTTMGFSTERQDALWWLMVSADSNANRMLISVLDEPDWKADIPRLVKGSLSRQRKGHWNTTVANAWGVLAMEKFSAKFEAIPVSGTSSTRVGSIEQKQVWANQLDGGTYNFAWANTQQDLSVTHDGKGAPWLTVTARAAIPLKQALSTGYKIKRTVTPLKQAVSGKWSAGDIARISLDVESQSDMTWVALNDPIPAGASILGSGLGGDSRIMTKGEKKVGWVWPAFEERRNDSFRSFYRYVPKGNFKVEYSVRYNNAGRFALPSTRVEAMYAPEMFGEVPNPVTEIGR